MSNSGRNLALDLPYSGLQHNYNADMQTYNATASAFRFWRTALARQASGGAAARLHCYGDSVTWGLFQNDPLQTTSYPGKLISILNGWVPCWEGPIWFSKPQLVSGHATVTDTRVTIGAGWVNQYGTANYPGAGDGTMLLNSTTTNSIDFGAVTCDSFTIYYLAGPSFGSFNWSVDAGAGTAVSTTNSVLAVKSVQVSAGAVGSHTLHIANGSTTTTTAIFAVEYNDSTRAQTGIKISRAGNPGATSANWSMDTDASKSLASAYDIVQPDLTVLMLGDNDYNNNIDPAVYYSNMAAIVDRARTQNGDVLLVAQPAVNASGKTYTQDAYRRQLYSIADSRNVAVLDFQDRWPNTWTIGNGNPYALYADGFHPSNKGYQDMAQAVANVIKAVS